MKMQLPAKAPDPWAEIGELKKQLVNVKDPDPQLVRRLRRLLVETPGALSFATSMTQLARKQLIGMVSAGYSQAYMLAEIDNLKQAFGYDTAPVLERLLIDHILTVRLRLIHAEFTYNQALGNQTASLKERAYLDNLLTSTQARFLRAIETLARVRRLAKNNPLFQLNIANAGGRQFVVGEMHNQAPAGMALQQQNLF